MTRVSLDDKYTLDEGSVFMTGTQALVRLPLVQRKRDMAAGLNTAGFISGYRGSPLGNYDAALWAARDLLGENAVRFQPGVNEDLAATSCWGTQQAGFFSGPRHDGVFAIWYGKGPGVDRSGDALKHGNLAGTSPHGGVLVLAGDDHGAKSSTTAHQSEFALQAAMIPILNPATIHEYLDYGLAGLALSRFAGVWVGFKCLTETIESAASVSVNTGLPVFVEPEDVARPAGGWHISPRKLGAVQEEDTLIRYRLPAVKAFVRANRLDRVMLDSKRRELGIVAVGKAYLDVRQALMDLGLDEDRLAELGVRIYKPALTWPLEEEGARAFISGHREVLVIEEKRPLVEDQLARILLTLPAADRPELSGKTDPAGRPLLPAHGELRPATVAEAIATRLMNQASVDTTLRQALEARIDDRTQVKTMPASQIPVRAPAFCSGCPHNTSTRLPDGSKGLAGIGCHTLALFLPDRPTMSPTQMGGEGANWIGAAPFVDEKHVFQNLGDGTYFHSGLLAIRAAVSAKVNVTYKILYNDAVAMTGGQPVDGTLAVPDLARQVLAEGINSATVVTDEPEKYRGVDLPAGVLVHHRDDLDAVQRELREQTGVTVMIYDQTCATEKRRRRKRNRYPDPPKRFFINQDVCEGCGDCSDQSNCVSIQPVETDLGRKRRIDQSSCNKDYSCVKGFCPSFVTVHGGSLRKPKASSPASLAHQLPAVDAPELDKAYNFLVTGVGGTGVVTVGAILGMAAHIEGKACSVFDLTGLSQKNGAVMSHVRLARRKEDLTTTRIGPKGCTVLLGCDLLVAASSDALATVSAGDTAAVVNSHLVPTAEFQRNPDMDFHVEEAQGRIADAVGEGKARFVDATRIATAAVGDTIGANIFMLGYAYQQGLVPLSEQSLMQAIELNGVAVEMNKAAFAWGRHAATDPDAVLTHLTGAVGADEAPVRGADGFLAMLESRHERLRQYQDRAYADRYHWDVMVIADREEALFPGNIRLATAVAENLFKLMAYKDEYEVARLYTESRFLDRLNEEFEGDFKLGFNLAPPLLARKDKTTGLPRKREYGPWVFSAFKVLARLKWLRGTLFDPFGYHADRRLERKLIEEYRSVLQKAVAQLSAENYDIVVELAEMPGRIRGYGHVKDRSVAAARTRTAELLEKLG